MFGFLAAALLMVVMVVAFVLRALWQGGADNSGAEAELALYKSQLRQLDKDVARGLVGEAEAETLRAEIGRRVLAADAALQSTDRPVASRPKLGVAMALAVTLVGGGAGLYWALGQPGMPDYGLASRLAASDAARANRPSQEAAEAQMPPQAEPNLTEEVADMVARLRQATQERPDDLEGQRLLVQTEARLGRFADAWRAQDRVLAALGPEAPARAHTDAGELRVLAAGGYVSPEAEAQFREALARDPSDPRARYYMGLMLLQAGRPDQTFPIWERLLRESAPGDLWVAPIRAELEAVAQAAGIRYQLPPLAQGTGPTAPGPTAADIEAAEAMSAEDRQAMIASMVEGLEARLAAEGGTAEEFARLIQALTVLGRTDHAQAIYREALQNFADRPGDLALLEAAGAAAGLAP